MEEITFLNKFLPFQVVEVNNERSVEEVAKLWNISTSQILSLSNTLKRGDKIILKDLNVRLHIVKPGETLESIAKLHNMTREELLQKNKITRLFIGQQLIL
jgi:LysM repeat protein